MSTQPKVVIVTGASQGIGAAAVAAYREAGCYVVANSRSIRSSVDPGLLTIAGDIADPLVARLVIDEALARFGRVDTLVNNAGVFTSKPFIDFTTEDFARNIGTNLAGFFYLTQEAIRSMEPQRSGHIVQITTALADQPIEGVPAVLASLTKGGLNAATKSLAIEYAQRGIRVNAVAPGIVKTTMNPPDTHEVMGALHPLGRMCEISDVVDALLFLESAHFVTGQVLHVDGGQSAGR
jgi:NAD(P)-dependent dehydrogenase (short-subunit alcohol dehydrogenase family)